jgi:translation initiation factor IF-2
MYVLADDAIAPVRIFENFLSKPIKEASASSPVKIAGFNKPPEVGADFKSFASKKETERAIAESPTPTASNLPEPKPGAENKQMLIPIIIKADVAGSKEALEDLLQKLETEQVKFNLLRSKVGDINEDDIKLAASGENPLVIGFNVGIQSNAQALTERFGIKIRVFNIIYEAEDWLKEKVALLAKASQTKETVIGKAKIIKIFKDEKNKKIVGGEVLKGRILSGKNVKIYRRDFLLGEGKMAELQHQQNKISEAKEGEQFGALLQTKVSVAPKDKLELVDTE